MVSVTEQWRCNALHNDPNEKVAIRDEFNHGAIALGPQGDGIETGSEDLELDKMTFRLFKVTEGSIMKEELAKPIEEPQWH